MKVFLVLLGICISLNACASTPKGAAMTKGLPNFDKLWSYSDPVGTRAKFIKILPDAEKSGDKSYYLQLQTQIARTWSLDMGYEEAHKILDDVEASLTLDLKLVRVRYLLERGRTFRSSGSQEKALPLFEESFELAKNLKEDFFAVDAAHMVALIVTDPKEKQKWNLIGIEVAEGSKDERARGWLGSLYNNMGWDYHDKDKYEKALDMFEKALAFREKQGNQEAIGIAKWCVARAYRSLKRHDDALEIQLGLLKEYEARNHKSGYVFEELGELYLIRNEKPYSQKYFALAYEELSKDPWLMKHEVKRLERIKKLSGN